jgi:hypothetical protein
MAGASGRENRSAGLIGALIAAAAALLAGFTARPFAGGWNDGSRLAAVESLIDAHTLAIDHSVFVQVPGPPQPAPYPAAEPVLLRHGTLDKLFISGRYYSDKSPVPAVLLAGIYEVLEWATGWTARTHPDHFCRAMTLASSGLAYVLGVLGVYVLGGRLRLAPSLRILLAASFGLATVALPYTAHVNNHILLLGVTTWLTVSAHSLAEESRRGRVGPERLVILGFLAGLGYTIDLGVGPMLLACTLLFVVACCRRITPAAIVIAAALPWPALHHALNFAVGGTWGPANAVADYFRWPGSPFSARNLTGGWAHAGPESFLLYAASMLFGKRGFFGHNLPLFLLLPALAPLLRLRRRRPEVWWALGCCAGAWLLYAATSNNSSGQCLSIRWFVPLLAPAYLLLGLTLRLRPRFRIAFVLLSAWGGILVLLMREGPWTKHVVPGFWLLQAAALLSWVFLTRFRPAGSPPSPSAQRRTFGTWRRPWVPAGFRASHRIAEKRITTPF